MSGQEDFGPLLEALVTCVGVVDVVSLFAYIFDRTNAKKPSMDVNNNDVRSTPFKVRDESQKSNLTRSIPQVVVDGTSDGDVIDSLRSKVNELEAKVTELEIRSRESSMERFVEMERERFTEMDRQRRSRTPSPYPHVESSKDDESSSFDDGETNTSSTESRSSLVEQHPSKLITRDDEFRKTKRSSQISHDSREEELTELTKLEQQESESLDDYVHIVYEGQDDSHYRHGISPIQEVPSCPVHGEIERSPEPGMSSMIEKPWCDIKKDVGDIRKQEKKDQMRRSLSIDEQPAAEAKAVKESEPTKIIEENQPTEVTAVDVNENFIKMEKNMLQQQSKLLVKQAHVSSEDQPEETTKELEVIPLPVVEIINEPESVKNSLTELNSIPSLDVLMGKGEGSTPSLDSTLTPSIRGSTPSLTPTVIDNDFAVRSTTPEPDVSIQKIKITDVDQNDRDLDIDLANISGSPSSGEGLKRTKRCIDSLDRSASRSSSRLSRGKKSPSVASEEDYKEWFDKFDNHITPNLEVPEYDDDEFDSDIEEDFLAVDASTLNGAEICKIEDGDVDTRDVSVSVTLNLKKSPAPVECFPCAEFQKDTKVYQTKGEEFLEMERFRENKNRRLSIVPSTDEQQKNYVSILHPEEFPPKAETSKREPHQHHEHLHNVGYNEWMKKIVDHHSSHLAMSDSDSDSDVSLDEVRMLPLFCDDMNEK